MPALRWTERPSDPPTVLVVAFGGWNDAGDAASGAVDHVVSHWSATPVATVDPEDLFDFTVTRPRVERDERSGPRLRWPTVELLHAGTPTGAGGPAERGALTDGVLVLRGPEPQLRWRGFAGLVADTAVELGCELVVTLGAFVAEVPHTRPTQVVATAHHPRAEHDHELAPSHYEGPTGILGVLHHECRSRDLPSAALWAAIPSYVPSAPSPKAALALVEHLMALLGARVPTMELTLEAAAYEHEISELVAEDDVTADYVRSLEELVDSEAMISESPADMVDEVERFLRDQ